MSGLVLPRHVAAARAAEKQRAAADSISRTAYNAYSSDDFATRKSVQKQLDALHAYIASRRETEPDYRLPQPSGWKIAVLMLTVPEETDGGLIVQEEHRDARAVSSPQGVILAMGPQAYKDPTRFTVQDRLNPWHQIGDRILWVKYDVSMFRMANAQVIGFMNDTQPMATVDVGWGVPDMPIEERNDG